MVADSLNLVWLVGMVDHPVNDVATSSASPGESDISASSSRSFEQKSARMIRLSIPLILQMPDLCLRLATELFQHTDSLSTSGCAQAQKTSAAAAAWMASLSSL